MDQQPHRFAYLYRQYITKACTQEEMQEFFAYVSNPLWKEQLDTLADEHLENLEIPPNLPAVDWDHMFNTIIPQHGVTPMRTRRRWLLAAASIILLISVGIFFLLQKKPAPQLVVSKPADVEAPRATKAQITLANGKTIILDSMGTGVLTNQEGVSVVKNEKGEISYEGQTAAIAYNTLSNPRGSNIMSLTLSDGSRVWLNAESSLRYPVAFSGNTREVEVTGEAYFEVAKNAGKKFLVHGGGVTTEVLGTHFNVNTYKEEATIKVTLLEGRVKVSNGEEKFLQPGQQAQCNGKTITVEKSVDLEGVMAWKNGRFSFNRTSLTNIVQQLARWYNVEVVYEGTSAERFITADISREKSLASILKVLEAGGVKFRLEGRTLTVIN